MNSSRHLDAPERTWPSTGWLALVGSTAFVSGFFLLAVAGQGLAVATHALVLGGATVLTLPILVLAAAVAGVEAVVGRAWASGFRALTPGERTARGILLRGLRYAGFLWLANGVALWFATLAAQV